MTDLSTSERAVLIERARRLARPLADVGQVNIDGETGTSLLVARLGEERVGIALDYTIEVYRASELTPIPGARPPVAGAIAWRGRVLTVLDVAHSRRAPIAVTDETRILVIGQRSASFAIVADEVDDVQDVNTHEIQPIEDVSAARGEFVRGVTRDAVVVLDVAALIARFAPTQQSTGVIRE